MAHNIERPLHRRKLMQHISAGTVAFYHSRYCVQMPRRRSEPLHYIKHANPLGKRHPVSPHSSRGFGFGYVLRSPTTPPPSPLMAR